jgi:type VI secretion system protein ImpL
MIAIVLTVFLAALLWATVFFLKLPLGLAIVGTSALVLAWAAALLWRILKARRGAHEGAHEIECALTVHAEAQVQAAQPDQQAHVEAMQAEFAKAVQALKASKLARGGRDALAVLPWYVIIGPPGAGKTTALRASGLKFPYLSKRGGVRGLGGTRDCEWWFTNEAVILDTAGRYATQEEDHDEWMGFLDTIARARPRKPVNGLLVALPITDVGAETEEGASELGRRMRERVDEVMVRLQVVLPVYVLFTKSDLLPGFVETFADLGGSERRQVWGVTIPLAAGPDRVAAFGKSFDELLAVAEERAMKRLADERQLAARERIYEFPQQLAAARPQLGAFLEALFAENVYQETPILRGAYLTSGTQEGRVVDCVMRAIAEAFGVRGAIPETKPVLEAKSYFLRDVFDKVLFPDQHIAFARGTSARRERMRRRAIAGVAAVVFLFSLAFPVRAFLANRAFLRSTADAVDAVVRELGAAGRRPPPLAALEPLRERLALLLRHEEQGPPWSMRLGLYRGNALLPHVRRVYVGAVRRLVLDPVFRQDADEMEGFVRRMEATEETPASAEYARAHEKLKLHLLLTSPRGLTEPKIGDAEQEWIARQVASAWAERAGATADPTGPKLMEKHAHLFAKFLSGDPALALPRDEALVRRARRVLARLPLAAFAEERLVAEVDGRGLDLTLSALVGRPVAALRARQGVRGAYTRRAYEEIVRPRLEHPDGLFEPWVLVAEDRPGEDRVAAERDRIRSRYFERYIEAWRSFLEGLEIDQDLELRTLLDDITSGEPAPYPRLFRAAANNTRIADLAGGAASVGERTASSVGERTASSVGERDASSAGERAASGSLQATGRDAGTPEQAVVDPAIDREEQQFGPHDVERAFAGLLRFGVPPDAPAAPGGASSVRTAMDSYQEMLVTLRDAKVMALSGGDEEREQYLATGTKARAGVRGLIRSVEGGGGPWLRALLSPPVNLALRDARGPVRTVAAAWCDLVAKPFRNGLGSRYPFARTGPDAAMADVAEFFRPEKGVVWGLYKKTLEGPVQRAGDGFRFADDAAGAGYRPELLTFLRQAQEITTGLFPEGAQDPSVSFSVRVRPTPRIASAFLQVDGQSVEYRDGTEEWHAVAWPNKSAGGSRGASLRVRATDGTEETIRRDGDFGFLRLLEQGSLEGDPGGRDFAMTFQMALGATVVVDLRMDRSEPLFFGARGGDRALLLEAFHSFPPTPPSIGTAIASCE